MHALDELEMAALRDLEDSEDGKGTPDSLTPKSVNVSVLTLERLEQRGMIRKASTLEQDGGSALARTYELTDKGQEALDQSK
jgi:DNA-binding PadR family transcriptional regulator